MSTPGVVLKGVRWSGVVASQCARRVAYEHADTPTPPIDEKTQALFDRGHRFEKLIVDEIVAELEDAGVVGERQAVLAWPPGPDEKIGETHVDFFATMPGGSLRLYEIKSKGDPRLAHADALQVAGQAILVRELTGILGVEHDVDAYVCLVDSHSGERRDIYVDPAEHEDDVRRLWQVAREGIAAATPADAERAWEHPGASGCFRCPFRDACWADWTAPPLDEVVGVDQAAHALLHVTQEIRDVLQHSKALHEKRDALRDELRPFVPIGEEVDAGGIRIKVTVSEAPKFSYSEARKAGLELPPEFDTFLGTTRTERWTVR